MSIGTILAGKGLEELNCISSSCMLCLCWTPVPEQWLVPPGCGCWWPRPPWAHTTCRVCREHEELSPSVPGSMVVQRGGSTFMLLGGIKQAATNPSVFFHWGCLVFLGLGGHTSRHCLCCQLRHRGFVLGWYRLVSLPLRWSCHAIFHIPWAGVQSLTMTLGWDWDLIQFPPGCF